MKAFDLDRTLVENYSRFARSFTRIRAEDIKAALDERFAAGRFWPDPLISINPNFESGAAVDALVRSGTLEPRTGDVFRVDSSPITLHRHQEQAVAHASPKGRDGEPEQAGAFLVGQMGIMKWAGGHRAFAPSVAMARRCPCVVHIPRSRVCRNLRFWAERRDFVPDGANGRELLESQFPRVNAPLKFC
jgi:hypothetical protein